MASLKVCALARAAAAWLPVGVTGCAPGHHPAGHGVWPGLTGVVPGPAERQSGLVRRQAQWAGGRVPPGFAAASCQISPCRPRGRSAAS
jgi:hypothetical protein